MMQEVSRVGSVRRMEPLRGLPGQVEEPTEWWWYWVEAGSDLAAMGRVLALSLYQLLTEIVSGHPLPPWPLTLDALAFASCLPAG